MREITCKKTKTYINNFHEQMHNFEYNITNNGKTQKEFLDLLTFYKKKNFPIKYNIFFYFQLFINSKTFNSTYNIFENKNREKQNIT